jgi:hypothetical protein
MSTNLYIYVYIYISIQRDATMHSIHSSFHCNIYSTCFGCNLQPSSGVQETVVVDVANNPLESIHSQVRNKQMAPETCRVNKQ